MLKQATVGMLVVFATTQTISAHDYWLQPQQFFLAAGETTHVQLFVGDHFISEAERPFQRNKTGVFQIVSENKSRDLKATARDGQKPVCKIAPGHAGNHLIVMQRDWSHIEIEAAKFNNYLEHEGLTAILQMRRVAGEDTAVGRERYRRYLKALIQVGDKPDDTYARKMGHRLEIVPRANPTTRKKGDRLTVSVLFEGQPLRGASVTAYNRQADSTKTQEGRTNDQGQANFKLDRSGLWLIRLVHMQRTKNVSGIDWESFWAAYSFQMK